jgi:hypothetical protein
MESIGLISGGERGRWLIAAASVATAAFVLAIVPSLASAYVVDSGITSAKQGRDADVANPGSLSPAARLATQQGYLVPDQAAYDAGKERNTRRALAAEELSRPLAAPASGPLAPNVTRQFAGINDPFSTPPDETSAVGRTRYVQLVNRSFAIYNKTSNTPISQGTLNSFVGAAGSTNVFDPQIMWDPTTNRFYYAADDVQSASANGIAFGFSKGASPSSAADWCKYRIGTGTSLFDYPKLGDSQHFLIIGSNVFASSGNFLASSIFAVTKPKSNDTCATFGNNAKFDEKSVAAGSGFTPTAVNEIDTDKTGWVVARAASLPSTKLSLYRVTRNTNNGNPVIQTTPTKVTVPSYSEPPNAPQQGSVNPIDTLDGRNTQAVAGKDPSRNGALAIWTQHTVRGGVGGSGAEVRWYEINPVSRTVLRSGEATSGSLFEYNGAISPNRQVAGQNRSGGNAMVMNFNASSSAARVSIRTLSKIGNNAQSGQVVVRNSPGQLSGFDCSQVATRGSCRWGDYAAATPDPLANRIWNVSQYAVGSGSGTSGLATSRTWHFVATP